MIAVDTNRLVYSHRSDSPFHQPAKELIETLRSRPAPWAIPWPCIHEFVAIVTHPRVFQTPTRNSGSALKLQFRNVNATGSGIIAFPVPACVCFPTRQYHQRSKDGAEVDFILERGGQLTPIEVKWTENPTLSDVRHLRTFLDEQAQPAAQGYVICRCPRPLQLHDQITALPWSCL
jgi:hypothetical protein